MSNTETALAGLLALEDQAAKAHKDVAEYVEGVRMLFEGATVLSFGSVYRITGLRAYRGVVKAWGVRCYGKYYHKIGTRDFDLGDFRSCKILKLHNEGDAIPTVRIPPKQPDPRWHPNHHGPALGETTKANSQ